MHAGLGAGGWIRRKRLDLRGRFRADRGERPSWGFRFAYTCARLERRGNPFSAPESSLAQIYAALTYYYENQGQLDAKIRRGLEESGELASQFSDTDLRSRLSNLRYKV